MFGPCPLHPLARLSAHLGGAGIWAKREDCNSGLAYGGNKIRKLEYLVADALAAGRGHAGHDRRDPVQPHPAGWAAPARVGLKAVLVQESWVDWPDALCDRLGNILLCSIMGADVGLGRVGLRHWIQGELEAGARGRSGGGWQACIAMPAGASDHPLGGLGYAGWAYEVLAQEGELGRFLRPAHRVQRDRQHAGWHDGWLRRPAAAAAGARDRRLREAGRDQGQVDRIARARPSLSAWDRTCATAT